MSNAVRSLGGCVMVEAVITGLSLGSVAAVYYGVYVYIRMRAIVRDDR